MTNTFGNIGLVVALLASATGLLAALVGGRFESGGALGVARKSLGVVFGAFTLSSAALFAAMINSDFRIAYVGQYTERALPLGYKLAAFWAGQSGSLLLWGWMIAALGVIWLLTTLKKRGTEPAMAAGTLLLVCGFFAALMLFAANPFELGKRVPIDGRGLNPMLQDPGMIAHPPLLFLGYAAFTVPFAMMVGALMARRSDNQWVAEIRRWLVAAWMFLTIGILLGAQWAYVELGWGGYWAWDPVENASLLPWLTGTALLHSVMVQQQRGMLKRWNASLLALTFILCIFGTFITRSGVVSSVHSFGDSPVGTFFLVFLAICIVGSIALLVGRRKLLHSEHPLETIWGREGLFMVTNFLLVVMTAVIVIGTMLPVISQSMMGRQVSVKEPFYNSVVVPMGLCLVCLMALGPLLAFGKDAAATLKSRLAVPLVGGVFVAAGLLLFGILDPWAYATAYIVGVGVSAIFLDLIAAVRRRTADGEGILAATLRVLDGNHRRYGGQVVHVGMLMFVVGVAGSGLYNQKHELTVPLGGTASVNGWTARLDQLRELKGKNYEALEGVLVVTDTRSGKSQTMRPQRRSYSKWEDQPNSEVAIWSNTSRDIYVTLLGTPDNARTWVFQLLVNPLVLWLWIGGIIMTVGALVCLCPRFLPGEQPATAVSPVPSRRGRAFPAAR